MAVVQNKAVLVIHNLKTWLDRGEPPKEKKKVYTTVPRVAFKRPAPKHHQTVGGRCECVCVWGGGGWVTMRCKYCNPHRATEKAQKKKIVIA